MNHKLLKVTFVEQVGPEHYHKATTIANISVCRILTLVLCREAFNRGNNFEVKIDPVR